MADFDFEYPQVSQEQEAEDATIGALGAIPGINFFTPAIVEGRANARRAQVANMLARNASKVKGPDFVDPGGIDYQYAGDFNPEAYGAPELATATLAEDSPEGRAAQLEALQEMSRVTDQSVGSGQAMRRRQAETDARQLANSREQAIRTDAMRRGRLGGTADMLAREQSAQAAANRNLDAGMQNAHLAALEELAGTQAKGTLASTLRAGDQALAFNNADALNRFNMFNTGMTNSTNQRNVDNRNSAALGNRDARQTVMNDRTKLGMAKNTLRNANKQQVFDNQMTKYGAMAHALQGTSEQQKDQAAGLRSAGREGWQNTKDVWDEAMKFFGGGMGGGMGG